MAKSKLMFHILLCGPPGTGKTSIIKCLARELLQNYYNNAVLELNAADDRGIETVRQRIKCFAQEKIILPENLHKIVILDEVESMTESAQQTLRRIFEQYSDLTRFALACNVSEKVIEPLQSRCVKLYMQRIEDSEVRKLLAKIADENNVPYTNDALDVIVYTAQGDLRSAIGLLQVVSVTHQQISIPEIYSICNIPPFETINTLLSAIRRSDISICHELIDKLLSQGHQAYSILRNLKRAINNSDFSEDLKTELAKQIAYTLCENEYIFSAIQLE